MTHRVGASPVHAALSWLVGWLAMSTVMMVPAALPAIRFAALTSLWSRRQRTVALFVLGYLGVWLLFGLLSLGVVAGLRFVLDIKASAIAAAVLVLSALWQLTRWKRRAIRACHRIPPLPPRGFAADRGCLGSGCRDALWCLVACWPFMFAMAAGAAIGSVVMIAVGLFLLVERVAARGTRRLLPLVATALFGAIAGVAGSF